MIFDVMFEMFKKGLTETLIELGVIFAIVGTIAIIILVIHDWR